MEDTPSWAVGYNGIIPPRYRKAVIAAITPTCGITDAERLAAQGYPTFLITRDKLKADKLAKALRRAGLDTVRASEVAPWP